jgi:hypothetical protein
MMNALFSAVLAVAVLAAPALPVYPGSMKSAAAPSTREKCGHEVTTTAGYIADNVSLDTVNAWYRRALPNGTPVSTAGLMKDGMSLHWDMILTNAGSAGVVLVAAPTGQVIIAFAKYAPPITPAELNRFKTCQ